MNLVFYRCGNRSRLSFVAAFPTSQPLRRACTESGLRSLGGGGAATRVLKSKVRFADITFEDRSRIFTTGMQDFQVLHAGRFRLASFNF
ncbi:MAG: hypothetical protein GYA55_07915 [SAR324 cluster bacterium]|uniref:Uncharacterized protein n=1 Tax=SAR324 cluster bacterium TaxID=2024889 RepID=A0A7X9FRR0_9DELT|nr:hypothetical protein [SAR324 cluster bacterium]